MTFLFADYVIQFNFMAEKDSKLMQDFIHLHVHTQYSILDGQASIAKLVDKAIADFNAELKAIAKKKLM